MSANGGDFQGGVAVGANSVATGSTATAIGPVSTAKGGFSVALGAGSNADGSKGIAIGFGATTATDGVPVTEGNIAIGSAQGGGSTGDLFTGDLNVPTTNPARATGGNGVALGTAAQSTGAGAIAIGGDSTDLDGLGARATGTSSVALGADAQANSNNAMAFGSRALANNVNAIATGTFAKATGVNAIAIGRNANASNGTTIALGDSTSAAFAGSTALGKGATTTKANQVRLGGTGSSVSVGDIEASTAAQVGDLFLVTVDASGTLGKQSSIAATGRMISLASLLPDGPSMAQFDTLAGRVGNLEGRVDTLYDLAQHDRRENRRGIAATAALTAAPMPSAAGRTSYAANTAVYRGQIGFGAAIAHRIGDEDPFALTAGLSHAGGKNTVARVGFAGEF